MTHPASHPNNQLGLAEYGNDALRIKAGHFYNDTLSLAGKMLLLVSVALLLQCFSSIPLIFATAVAIASILGLVDLFRIVLYPQKMRLSGALAVSALLGYGLGSLIYLTYYGTTQAALYQYWAPFGLFFSQEDLSQALAAVLLACAALYAMTPFERPLLAGFPLVMLNVAKAEWLAWLGLFVIAAAVWKNKIGYMGAAVNEAGHVSPLGAIAVLMAPPLIPYMFLLITGNRSIARRIALTVGLLLLLGTVSTFGRRYLLYTFVLLAIAWRMRYSTFTKKNVVMAAVTAIFAITFLYLGFEFFMALRLTIWKHGTAIGVANQVQITFTHLTNDTNSFFQHKLARNDGTRPFILSYLAGLMGIKVAGVPLLGKELLYSLKMAIPSVLMPDKLSVLPSSPEALVHPIYGISVFDGPNSIFTAGFNDFGIAGLIIYPIGIVFIMSISYKILRSITSDLPMLLVFSFALLFQLLYIEQALSQTFSSLRDLFVLLGLLLIIRNSVFIFNIFIKLRWILQKSYIRPLN